METQLFDFRLFCIIVGCVCEQSQCIVWKHYTMAREGALINASLPEWIMGVIEGDSKHFISTLSLQECIKSAGMYCCQQSSLNLIPSLNLTPLLQVGDEL